MEASPGEVREPTEPSLTSFSSRQIREVAGKDEESLDLDVGVVLDALEKSEQADNTIVILTSDHGYHMGEKDHLFKNTASADIPNAVAGDQY